MTKKSTHGAVELLFAIFIGVVVIFVVVSGTNLALPTDDLYTGDWSEKEQAALALRYLVRSVVVLVVAVALMVGSLFLSHRYRVFSNGAFFGGVFSTVYALVNSTSYLNAYRLEQFLFTIAALVAVLVVGWLKFSKLSKENSSGGEAGVLSSEEAAALAGRLSLVEEKLEGAADLFRKTS